MTTACESFQAELPDLLYGELPPERKESAESHAAGCSGSASRRLPRACASGAGSASSATKAVVPKAYASDAAEWCPSCVARGSR